MSNEIEEFFANVQDVNPLNNSVDIDETTSVEWSVKPKFGKRLFSSISAKLTFKKKF